LEDSLVHILYIVKYFFLCNQPLSSWRHCFPSGISDNVPLADPKPAGEQASGSGLAKLGPTKEIPVAFCPSCGTQLPDGATACPKCAAGATSAAASAPAAGLTDNLGGLLAYLFIPAILFLVIEPYNKRKFIRFHSFQCIFLAVAGFVLGIGLNILWHVPFLGWLVLFLLWPIIGLAEFILWLFLMYKAYQGEMFKLPVIGDMAEKQANAM